MSSQQPDSFFLPYYPVSEFDYLPGVTILTQHHHRQVYAYLALTTSIWGSLYIAARLALQTIPPITLLCLWYAFAFTSLLAISRVQKDANYSRQKIDRADYGSLAFIGVVGYFLSIGAQLSGTKYVGASVASLINAMNPISISLFAVLFLKERLTFRKIIAVLASVSGAYIILLRAET